MKNSSYIEIHARGSGRTTRMIEEALRKQEEGRAVYILCHDSGFKRYVEHLAMKICRMHGKVFPSSIKFETVESLGGTHHIDWKNKTIHGAHPNCALIIDHHVWATHFGFAIDGFHEYDNQIIVNTRQIIENFDLYIPLQSR